MTGKLRYDHPLWIAVAVFFLPIWWLLGIDQLVWYVLALVLALFAGLKWRDIQRSADGPQIICLTVLMIAVAATSIMVVELPVQRKLTYARDALTWLIVWVLICTTALPKYSLASTNKMLAALVFTAAISSCASIFVWLTGYHGEFSSVATHFFPASIVRTGLGQAMFEKSLLRQAPSMFFGEALNRVQGLFLYSNTFAAALTIAIPLCVLFIDNVRMSARKVLGVLILSINVAALLLTTSRSAMLAEVCGLFVFILVRYGWRLNRYARYLIVAAALLTVAFVFALYFSDIQRAATAVADARGGGMNVRVRVILYVEALHKALQNPFGYGTYMNVPGYGNALPPLGSHSEYVGVLFKYGFIGLAAYGAFLSFVWRKWFRGMKAARSCGDMHGQRVLAALAWCFAASCVHQVTMESTLDVSVAMFNIVLWIAIDIYSSWYMNLHRTSAGHSGVLGSLALRRDCLIESAQ